jgi:hypothetical protein
MWSPALAAVLTKLAFREHLRELGLAPKSGRMQVLAYGLPFLYATPIYVAVWLGMQTGFSGTVLVKAAEGRFPDLASGQAILLFIVLSLSFGFLDKATRAWRGNWLARL